MSNNYAPCLNSYSFLYRTSSNHLIVFIAKKICAKVFIFMEYLMLEDSQWWTVQEALTKRENISPITPHQNRRCSSVVSL